MTLQHAVLKEDQTFLVSDPSGDLVAGANDGQGLYYRDTRCLSEFELFIGGARPQLLAASGEFNFITNLQLANPVMSDEDGQALAPRTVSVRRNRFLHLGLHERLGLLNYNAFPIRLRLRLHIGADFRDMFDVRGYLARPARGILLAPVVDGPRLRLAYQGLDGVRRWTDLTFDPPPADIRILPPTLPTDGVARAIEEISGIPDSRVELPIATPRAEVEFELVIPPKQFRSLTFQVVPQVEGLPRPPSLEAPSLDAAFETVRHAYEDWDAECTTIETDNEVFDGIVRQARHDLRLLSEASADGYVPSAGIPWFAVPFGRDSLIVGAQTLALNSRLARGALRFLAERQGTRVSDWRDEEPGKILHEVRFGEMASLEEVPHLTYYGSVDSTPLFLMLLGQYLEWTADEAFARELLPTAERALAWIDRYGDLDGDGYLEYRSRSSQGIRNQGWKDSHDSISDKDGLAVDPPIALVEVQGYVYAARVYMARLLERLGQQERAAALRAQAEELARRFERDFWMPDAGSYALALDAGKRQVTSVSSNPGHCLWSGLITGERARLAAARMLAEDMRSGWGVRTLSALEPTFNPMSYHNGSVWPHDNSLLAAGLKLAGLDEEATLVSSEVLEATMRMPGQRPPELFCGFARDRRYHSLPAQYPVSCSPQAWAAGSVFLFLQALLGLRANAWERKVFVRPLLPEWLARVSLRRLRVGDQLLDLTVRRDGARHEIEYSAGPGLVVQVEQAREPVPA